MNDIPTGSLWTHRETGAQTVVLTCVDAHDPPSDMKMIQYHLVQENRTLVTLAYVGEWRHTYVLLSE
jgi:hypothetical protein